MQHPCHQGVKCVASSLQELLNDIDAKETEMMWSSLK